MRSGWRSSRSRTRLNAAGAADTFRLLAGVSSECFYELAVEVDCGLRLAWADPRLVELTGYTVDELRRHGRLLRSGRRCRPAASCTAATSGSWSTSPAPIRYRLRRKSGELRWVQDHARAERAPGSDVVCRIVGTLADVSDSGWAAVARRAGARGGAARGDARGLPAVLDTRAHPVGREGQPRRWAAARACRPELSSLLPAAADLARLAGRGGGGAPAAALPPGLARRRRRADARGPAGPAGDDLVQVVAWPARCRRAVEHALEPGLLDALREPLLLVGPDRRILEVNSAFERLIGSARTELVGAAVVERLATTATASAWRRRWRPSPMAPNASAPGDSPAPARRGARVELRLRAMAPSPGRVEAVLIEAHRLDEQGSRRSATASAG